MYFLSLKIGDLFALSVLFFIIGAKCGSLIFNKAQCNKCSTLIASRKPTELLFFPDRAMTCNSYFDSKPCRNRGCTHLHRGDTSSLMKIMATLKEAEYVDLCMFRFTLTKVADCFIRLHRQGTRIRIITDNPYETIENNQIPRLKNSGILVREKALDSYLDDRSRPLMHNKFVIVDRKCCLLGSFNWTYQAVTRNQETIIKSYEPTVVAPLVNKFEEMWRELG